MMTIDEQEKSLCQVRAHCSCYKVQSSFVVLADEILSGSVDAFANSGVWI